jgi:hypothetical protein
MAILGAIMLAVILFHRGGLHALVGLLRRHGSG